MKTIRQTLLVVLALAVVPSPAAAQAPDWLHDLADTIAGEIALQAEAIARFVEQQVDAAQARQSRGTSGRGPEYTEAFERTVRLGSNGAFDLRNVSGDIVVTGGGGNDVRIEAVKRVRGAEETAARNLLSEMEIRVVERSGLVEVRTELPRRRNWRGAVDFTVSLPRGTRVTVQTVSGDVRVSNVDGELRSESVSGGLTVSSARDVRQVKTVSGDIDLSRVEGDDISLASVSGGVRLDGAKGRVLSAQSVSGRIRLTGVEVERVSIRSVSGDLDYDGPLTRNGRYEFQSHSGDVRVAPDGDRGFTLDATTFSGNVRSDLALTIDREPDTRRGRRNNALRGTFGDGSARLSVQSFSGDVVIAQR